MEYKGRSEKMHNPGLSYRLDQIPMAYPLYDKKGSPDCPSSMQIGSPACFFLHYGQWWRGMGKEKETRKTLKPLLICCISFRALDLSSNPGSTNFLTACVVPNLPKLPLIRSCWFKEVQYTKLLAQAGTWHTVNPQCYHQQPPHLILSSLHLQCASVSTPMTLAYAFVLTNVSLVYELHEDRIHSVVSILTVHMCTCMLAHSPPP